MIKKKKGCKLGCWSVIGLLLAILCIVCVVTLVTLSHSAKSESQKEVQLARESNLPLTPADLHLVPPSRAADNAVPLYVKAVGLMPSQDVVSKAFRDIRAMEAAGPMNAAQIGQARAQLRALQRAANIVESAAGKHVYYFERDWGRSYVRFSPHYSAMRTLASMECLEAELAAEERQPDEVFRRLTVAEKIGQQCGADPVLAANLISRACDRNALLSLAKCIRISGFDPGFIDRAGKFLDTLPPPCSLRLGLEGQLVLNRSTLYELPKMSDPEVLQIMMPGSVWIVGGDVAFLDHMAAEGYRTTQFEQGMDSRILRTFRVFFDQMPKDESDWPALEKAADKSAETLSEANELASFGGTAFLFRFHGVSQAAVRSYALRRMARVMVLLLRMKTLPDKLPDFGPGFVNPFTLKPFSYTKRGKGFKLYFGVPNRADSGGDPRKGDTVLDLSR